MNAVILQQTAIRLSQQTKRWDRRLRLILSVIWLPRGLIVGLLIGITIAIIARLKPWLLPDQMALAAVSAVLVGGVGVLVAVWGWPRSETHNARFFDLRFDLKERVSTALELTGGLIPVPDMLAEHQLNDAVTAAGKVDVRAGLPFEVRIWELAMVLGLGATLIFLLLAPNSMADKLRSQRAMDNAINQQIQDLEQAIEAIEANDSLTPEEQAALTQPLEEAQDILSQPDISEQEAAAAMAEAAEQMNEMADGMSAEDEAAYQDAAQNLTQSQMTSDLAEALQEPDLSEAGDAMDDLADNMRQNELDQQAREDLAERLEQAADAIQETNPELAEKMRETAEALRQGDMEAAQEAAREAGELLREQEEAQENSPSAQAAQDAQEQLEESQREMAQADQNGEQQPSSEQQSQQSGDQQGEQQGQQQGNDQQGQQPGQQEGQQPGQDGEQAQPGEGEAESSEASESETEGQSAAASQADQSGQQANQQGAAQQIQQNQDAGGGADAGNSEGGAGNDDTAGVMNQSGPGEVENDADPSASGVIQEFNPEFDSSTIGGESTDVIDVGGTEPEGDEGETINQGEFSPNPEGESTLSYTGVYNEYRDIVSNALESGRIPLDQRDIIHDYFSSLDQ
ncbi:MAG: hypothetical protein JXA10_11860 [Anaerolineae bacterium]|nr:hypothetical protein [Anaerolineae bacterium]